jgi:hypothetical protein
MKSVRSQTLCFFFEFFHYSHCSFSHSATTMYHSKSRLHFLNELTNIKDISSLNQTKHDLLSSSLNNNNNIHQKGKEEITNIISNDNHHYLNGTNPWNISNKQSSQINENIFSNSPDVNIHHEPSATWMEMLHVQPNAFEIVRSMRFKIEPGKKYICSLSDDQFQYVCDRTIIHTTTTASMQESKESSFQNYILYESLEENPLFHLFEGMGSRLVNYVKLNEENDKIIVKNTNSNNSSSNNSQNKYASMVSFTKYLQSQERCTLIGDLENGEECLVFENNLYNAPVAFHESSSGSDEFILILEIEIACDSFNNSGVLLPAVHSQYFELVTEIIERNMLNQVQIDCDKFYYGSDKFQNNLLMFMNHPDECKLNIQCRMVPLPHILCVGQQEPKVYVPKPRTKQSKEMLVKINKAFIVNLLRQKIILNVQNNNNILLLQSDNDEYDDDQDWEQPIKKKRGRKPKLETLRKRQQQQKQQQKSLLLSSSQKDIYIFEKEILSRILCADSSVKRAMEQLGCFKSQPSNYYNPVTGESGVNMCFKWDGDQSFIEKTKWFHVFDHSECENNNINPFLKILTPEDVCIFFTFQKYWLYLKQEKNLNLVGDLHSIVSKFQNTSKIYSIANYINRLLDLSPWNLTRSFGQYKRGVVRLRFSGYGCMFPHDYGFSLLSAPHRINKKKIEKYLPLYSSETAETEINRVILTIHEPTKKEDTNADLRRITKNKIKDILLSLNYSETEIESFERWDKTKILTKYLGDAIIRGEIDSIPEDLIRYIRKQDMANKNRRNFDSKQINFIHKKQMRLLKGLDCKLFFHVKVSYEENPLKLFSHQFELLSSMKSSSSSSSISHHLSSLPTSEDDPSNIMKSTSPELSSQSSSSSSSLSFSSLLYKRDDKQNGAESGTSGVSNELFSEDDDDEDSEEDSSEFDDEEDEEDEEEEEVDEKEK